jgi:PilZ domain
VPIALNRSTHEHKQNSRNVSASTIERRRRPRYLLSQPKTIHPSASVALGGISIEMSESGMSAMVNGVLQVGQTVELEPIAGDRAPAFVRHKLGQLYGFEFVGLTQRQVDRIAETCKKLGRHRSHAIGR